MMFVCSLLVVVGEVWCERIEENCCREVIGIYGLDMKAWRRFDH
jgi:hypothetical protein